MTSGYIAAASFGQRQLRYLDLIQPGRAGYAVPLVVEITGAVDTQALNQAFAAVIDRHDVLRASFPLVDGIPVLAVRDHVAIALPVVDVPARTPAEWRDDLNGAVAAIAARPFDLETGPVLAAALIRAANPATTGCGLALAVVFHHAVADGGSLPIFLNDLIAAYDAARTGMPPRWPELDLQYPDYADWEQERFGTPESAALGDALHYWRQTLQDVPALLDLPLDRRRGAVPTSGTGATARLDLPGAVGTALRDITRRHGATPFQAFLAVFFVVLHRWSGLDDLIVTVPVSKRTRPELEPLIGLFVDTLPLRLGCGPDTTFDALLDAVHRTFLDGVRHRDIPFQQIVQAIGIERRSDVVPLMQILFGSLDPAAEPARAIDGTRFTVIDDGLDQTAKADLSVVYRHTAEQVELWCRYDPALFDRATVDSLLAWFGRIAAAVAATPARPVGDLPLIDRAAGQALIARFNQPRRPYPANQSVAALFAEVAHDHATRTAIDEDGRLTSYADLDDQAGRLAAALAAAGIGPGDAVVLVLPLSARFIALVLAILRLGAIYVPLDPAHPHAHRAALATSVGARAVILPADADPDYGAIPALSAEALESRAAELAPCPLQPLEATRTAYIMFTSGSTGLPKGVAVPHRAIIRLVRDTSFASFSPDTRAAVYSNPSFDAATLELWAPLLNGGTAVVVDRRAMLDAAELRRILANRAITLLWITAGLFHEIAGIDPTVFAGRRLVITGGDVVSPDTARAVLAAGAAAGLRLLNAYGPTENTTFSTTFDISDFAADALSVPIGRPIANSTVYILDRCGEPLPVGVIGEIHVGGDGVASGYVGEPERTAAAFLPDPFAESADARMYRTGDFGRWHSDGTILFAGRADDQVKVRGFRIELTEIAEVLARHPALRAVHVAAPRQAGGERHIVAYVVARTASVERFPIRLENAPAAVEAAAKRGARPARADKKLERYPTWSETALAAADLRSFLEPLLPPHMLPHAYVVVDNLALNLNGKVDRKALPPVKDHHYDRADHMVAPRTEAERSLAVIWQTLLGLEAVGVTDNFFHVGGDSILAIRMAARAADAGLPLTPADVFQLRTIERLADAARIARPRHGRVSAERVFPTELVPAVVLSEDSSPFLLASLVFDRPVGIVDLALAVQRLAERHEALRLRWSRDGTTSRLEIMAYVAQLPIRTVEACDLADAQLDDWIAAHAARIGRGLDMAAGVTIAATLIDRGTAAGPVAVLALHRAVADDRTLVLLTTELETAIKSGALPALDGAASYADWLDWLEHYADTQAAGGGLAALEAAAMRMAAPPALAAAPADRTTVVAERWLDAAVSTALVDSVPAHLTVAPLDILATAVAAALPPSDGEAVLIEAVDGRRSLPAGAPEVTGLFGNLDGALAILAPTGAMSVGERLRAVKIARQAVEATAPVYRILDGTFDLPAATLGIAWSMALGQGGMRSRAHGAMRLHSLPTVGAAVKGLLVATTAHGRLRLAWVGAEPAGGAAAMLERVDRVLTEIADLAVHSARRLYTPADFPLAGLSAADLDGIIGTATDIDDIYPLSPMQEAMLVHSLAAVRSQVNFEQSCMRLRGPLDHEAFRHAWATVFERHDVLRTAFHWRGLARPLQVVHRAVPLPMVVETWPGFDAARLDACLAADRARGFDLERAPLVRLRLLQVAEDDVYIIASFHHLLVDGWCLGRLEREVRAAYESCRSRRPPLFDPPVPYRSYIAWLAQVDRRGTERFFANLLSGLPARRRLFPPSTEPAGAFTTTRRTLDHASSRALAAFARRRGLTLAATLHFAWAAWLGARLGTDDVVFGSTVSGRPAGLPGVEAIVGLFINNLPVRMRLAANDRIGERLGAMQELLGQLQDHAHLSPSAVAAAAGGGGRSGALFDTLVVVENLASGTSAWSGADGLTAEAVHSRLKTAYDLTFIAVPGDSLTLSLVQPDDGRVLEDGQAVLEAVAAGLTALPEAADRCLSDLPRPAARQIATVDSPTAMPRVTFATRPRSTHEAHIADVLADLFGAAAEIDLDTDFWRMGINSLELIQLALRLEQRLGRPVPISLLLEHRSVAALARAIESGQRWTAVVPMNGAAGSATAEPFVCVHPVAGDVSVYLDLARAMPDRVPFWAIQAAGLEEGQVPLDRVEALAAANLTALAERGLAHPRRIGGYSFGGLIAFEMARQLAGQGTPPERVIIIDTPAPLERSSILDPDPDRAHAQWLVRMADVRARFQGVAPVLAAEELLTRPAAERFQFALDRLHAARLVPPAADAGWLERAHRTSLVQYHAYLTYTPEPDTGLPLALIRATTPRQSDLGDLENRQLALADLGWGRFADGPVAVHPVAGDHVTMLAPDSAPITAAAILRLLEGEG